MRMVSSLEETGYVVEVHSEDSLLWSPMEHELVPRHEVMTKSQIAAEITSNGMSLAQLPKMLRSQCMSRVLGATAGDVVRITRPKYGNRYYRHVTTG